VDLSLQHNIPTNDAIDQQKRVIIYIESSINKSWIRGTEKQGTQRERHLYESAALPPPSYLPLARRSSCCREGAPLDAAATATATAAGSEGFRDVGE
jgi:hypothetical protein